jgi:hypothetical protein
MDILKTFEIYRDRLLELRKVHENLGYMTDVKKYDVRIERMNKEISILKAGSNTGT